VDQRHSDLLSELRCAMGEALGKSKRVIVAIIALQHAGQDVKISIDASLTDIGFPGGSSLAITRHSDSDGLLTLNATDMLFLRDLRISVEIGTAGR
jgi:hypothetical protein